MKKKDLIQKIKETAINEMPDVMNRIDISNIHIDEPETIKSPFNFKRAISWTFASLFVVLSGVFTYNFGYLPNVTNTSPLENDTELVGFQTVSAAALLTTFDIAELAYSDDDFVVQELSMTTFDLEDNIDLVNNYLNLAETVLGSEEQFIYESIDSDNLDYDFAYQYKGMDLAGNLIQYRIYYNEIYVQGLQNQTGIIRHNQNTYRYSMITTANSGTPVTRYTVAIDTQNRIEVQNNSDGDTQRFTYRVYIDGELDNESELILTSKNENLKAKINIKNRLNEEIELDIQRGNAEGDMQQFQIQYNLKSQNQMMYNGEFSVYLEMNQVTNRYQYKYMFNNQQVIIEDRPIKGNQKADDDDFTPGKGPGGMITTTTTETPTITTTTQNTNSGTDNNPGNDTTNNNPGNSNQTTNNGN